jgi:hypothetical protein
MRTNIVGTNCASVTRCRSISASACAGSNRSMRTTVAPRRCIDIVVTSGSAWYSGPGQRKTVSALLPPIAMRPASCTGIDDGSPNGVAGSFFRTPLGRPVVPDEYSISRPSRSSSSGVPGCAARTSS